MLTSHGVYIKLGIHVCAFKIAPDGCLSGTMGRFVMKKAWKNYTLLYNTDYHKRSCGKQSHVGKTVWRVICLPSGANGFTASCEWVCTKLRTCPQKAVYGFTGRVCSANIFLLCRRNLFFAGTNTSICGKV